MIKEETFVMIDKEKCNQCGLCKKACVFVNIGTYNAITEIPKEYCINCGHCISICPKDAITHPMVEKSHVIQKDLPRTEDMLNLIYKSRSIRNY